MKATAIAPSNIAFIKYWGKADEKLRLPLNSSISMNLSDAVTTTTMEFDPQLNSDDISLAGGSFNGSEMRRVSEFLEVIREYLGIDQYARVCTKNSFPKGAGAASSASGFAALTTAAVAAAGHALSEKELSVLARIGSGSACRSIPDGFVEWTSGKTSEESYAYSLYPHTHWDLRDILVIVDESNKKVSTRSGMEQARTSPFLTARLSGMEKKLTLVREALRHKDIEKLGVVIEEEAVNMHAVMMTQTPPLYYWNGATMEIVREISNWRNEGIGVFFTIDAGPNVHLICEAKDEMRVLGQVRKLAGIKNVLINKPALGAHTVESHLF